MADNLTPVPRPRGTPFIDVDGNLTPPWETFLDWLYRAILAVLSGATLANNSDALGPYSTATNISADLYGAADTRPGTWGFTDYAINPITFVAPPAGYRVRVLRVYGNATAMPKLTTPAALPVGGYSGWLFGLQTTAPDGSIYADFAGDSAFVYLQGNIGPIPEVIEFDFDVSAGGLLGTDNVMRIKTATFLNTLGVPIHIEPSFVIVFHYEPEP